MLLPQPSPAARPTGLAILESLGAVPSEITRTIGRSYPPASFIGRAVEIEVLRRAPRHPPPGRRALPVRGRRGAGHTPPVPPLPPRPRAPARPLPARPPP